MKRRWFIPAAVLAALALALGGCGGDDEEGGTEAGDGSITVFSLWGGSEQEAFQKVLDKFLTEGLVEEIPTSGSMPFWRKGDEGPVALRITAAGLAALQAGDAGASKRTIMRAHPGARGNKKRVGARPKQATEPARPQPKPQVADLQNRTG